MQKRERGGERQVGYIYCNFLSGKLARSAAADTYGAREFYPSDLYVAHLQPEPRISMQPNRDPDLYLEPSLHADLVENRREAPSGTVGPSSQRESNLFLA